MKRSVLVCTLILLASFAARAQYPISGKLVDKLSGEPVEAAAVTKDGASYVFSDKQGLFVLRNAGSGSTIQISRVGYLPKTVAVIDSLPPIIALERSSIDLKEVVVTAIGEHNHAFTTISKIDLGIRPAKSSQELLRYVPGLFIAQHQGGGKAEQIFLRGFDIDHGTDIAISVDGVPVNLVSHAHGQGYADLHFLIPEIVKNIEYGTGPYFANQGNFGTAGYASFETVDRLEKNKIQAELGSFGTARALGLFQLVRKAKQSAYVAGEYQYSNGPFESPQHFNRINITGKYNWQLNENRKLYFSVSRFYSKWDASGQVPQRAVDRGIISRFGAIDNTEGGNTGRTSFSLQLRSGQHQHQFNHRVYFSRYTFDLFSNFTFFLKDTINGDQIRQREKRNLIAYQGSYQLRHFGARESYTTTFGWGIRADQTFDSELSHTLKKTTVLERKALGDIREWNSFLYINEQISIGKFTLNPSVRMDYFRFNYQDKLDIAKPAQQQYLISPKISLSYNYRKNLQFFVKAGKGFHSNDTRVVVQNSGRQVLPAAYGSDWGLTWKPLKNLVVNTSAWYLYLQDELVYVGDEAVVEAAGPTRRSGLDFSTRYQPHPRIMIDIDLNYAYARQKDNPKGADYIPLAPNFTSVGGISYTHKNGWSGNLRYRYMNNRPANEENTIVAKGYWVNDLAIQFTRPKYEFGMSIENIFNVRWNEAQFETTSRLKDEPVEQTELHFTPGSPFFAKIRLAIHF